MLSLLFQQIQPGGSYRNVDPDEANRNGGPLIIEINDNGDILQLGSPAESVADLPQKRILQSPNFEQPTTKSVRNIHSN